MKNLKKTPTKQLEKFSNIFTQLGLVLVLLIVYLTLEHKTEQKTAIIFKPDKSNLIYIESNTEVFFTKEPKKIPKVKIPKIKKVFVDKITKGENTITEISIIDNFDDDLKLIDVNDIVEVDIIDEDPIVEDVDFISIENAPVFKGCENLSKEKNKVCFDKKIKQFVQRNFNVQLANDLGLHSGIHKIQTQFIINKEGNIIDVKIKAPHKRLEKETKRLIKKIPKFKPGKQNNKNVKVRYILPIAFKIQ